VLAFANLSDDKGNEYFSDGISEELLNVLAKVTGLKVTARTSSFHFKGKDTPIPEIAKQLGVAYVVEGSVRKSGDKVRITAQLIKADGFHVWSDTFTRDLKDIFAVQDEIAGLIAKNLELRIGHSSSESGVNPEAYQLLLQARHFARQQKNEGSQQALDYYHRVLALEPGSALAWAELAKVYIHLARFSGLPTADALREARTAAQKALELDPDQPLGLDALAWVQRTADWDWRGAQKSFQRALELAPGSPAIMSDAAVLYFNIGRIAEAIVLLRRAADLDPLSGPVQINLGDLLSISNHPEEGSKYLLKGIALTPEVEEYRSHLAYTLALQGHFPEATAVAEQETNEAYRLYGRAIVANLRGDQKAYAAARDELVTRHGAEMPSYAATLYACGHDNDQAFTWLDRAYAQRDSGVAWTKTNYFLNNLHTDARWPVFLRKMGLADDQLK
jgi:TolB-like protein/Flp pilus assembly protein TadD